MAEQPNPLDNRDHVRDLQPEDPLTAFFGPPMSIYSREQAVEDGVLVDDGDGVIIGFGEDF